jgi:hypothetical protein
MAANAGCAEQSPIVYGQNQRMRLGQRNLVTIIAPDNIMYVVTDFEQIIEMNRD